MSSTITQLKDQVQVTSITSHFQELLSQLADGDLSFYGAISAALGEVPPDIEVGHLFVATWAGHAVWYEVLEPPEEGEVFVRCYSPIFKAGEYDRVEVNLLAARVTRELFERARAHGFRTLRPLN